MSRADERARLSGWCCAHRGLHSLDGRVPENSLPAFRAAVEAGYGAELDVQLSRDGQVVVFHDDDLKRVCGVDARVDSKSLSELKTLPLLGSDERMPLFTQALDALKGLAGPLIVELKTGPRNAELCEKTVEILRGWSGNYCIESFDPTILLWFKKNAPDMLRGQLATVVDDYAGQNPLVAKLLTNCALNFLTKPDFIAYRVGARPKAVARARKRGVLLFGWTPRTPEEGAGDDSLIFEGFTPEPRRKT